MVIEKFDSDLIKEAKKIILKTHDGVFHADDVMSTALLEIFLERLFSKNKDEIVVIRSRAPIPEESEDSPFPVIIYDTGNGKFDHHFQGFSTKHDSGVLMSSLGLLWANLGFDICHHMIADGLADSIAEAAAAKAYNKVEKDFVEPIDLTDNFGQKSNPNTVSWLISSANNSVPKGDAQEEAFINVVNMMKELLSSAISRSARNAVSEVEASNIADASKDDYVVLEEGKFISAALFDGTHVKYVIAAAPDKSGNWNLLAVNSNVVPIYFSQEEMEGCVFCHVRRFCAAFSTKGAAINAAQKNLDYHEKYVE